MYFIISVLSGRIPKVGRPTGAAGEGTFLPTILAYHTYGLAPRMAEVRETISSRPTASGEDPARREFSRLHGISMTLNLVVLFAGAILILWFETFGR